MQAQAISAAGFTAGGARSALSQGVRSRASRVTSRRGYDIYVRCIPKDAGPNSLEVNLTRGMASLASSAACLVAPTQTESW